MYFDSINLAEGSSIEKLVVAKGTSFPASANMGELFFRTDENKLYAYSGTEWIASGSGGGLGGLSSSVPKITNVEYTDSSFALVDDTAVETNQVGYIKITGTGFVSGCNVAVGSVNATSVQFVNSTTLNVTIPGQAEGNYFLYLVNPDGGTAIKVNGVSFSNLPAWQSEVTLPIIFESTSVSIQLSATNATNYSLQSGSLPSGLTLSASGLISGTSPAVASDTQYTFTIMATDAQNQDSTRTFNLTVYKQISATGGTITTVGNYRVHTFTSSGTFTVNTAPPNSTLQVMVVGGGGGGGTGGSGDAITIYGGGGGGGGGGFLSNASYAVTTGDIISVVVGAGGGAGANGGNSSFGNLIATGGGAGGLGQSGTLTSTDVSGKNGGSGGGASGRGATGSSSVNPSGGSGTSGQGNSGGAGVRQSAAAGGGGAGGSGSSPSGAVGGFGGNGKFGTVPGTTDIVYSAGGGGGSRSSDSTRTRPAGGTAGAGNGAYTSAPATASVATSGTNGRGHGGGGGGRDEYGFGATFKNGAAGGSGVVVVAYQVQ